MNALSSSCVLHTHRYAQRPFPPNKKLTYHKLLMNYFVRHDTKQAEQQ